MQKLEKQMVLKDPIYGYIHIDDVLIKKLIDSSLFQRLRRIRQLSGVQMVFHGAEHSRFSHSLGVYELAYRFSEVIAIKAALDERTKLLFFTAALLHDIGHGAYSHAFEDVFGVHHEEIGARMIIERPEIRNLLLEVDEHFPEDVASIILKKGDFPLIEQLISSQLDIDRLDYLERDAFFTGTSYGHIDLDRILRVTDIKDGKVVFHVQGIHAIENYLVSRYHMYWQVYYHPVSRAYEIILEKIYLRVKDLCLQSFDFKTDVSALKGIINNPNDLEHYLRLDDFYVNGLISSFTTSDDDILRTLANDFLNRVIWKYIDDVPENETTIEDIKKRYGNQAKYFTSHRSVANFAYQDDTIHFGEEIMILLKDGKISTLKEQSHLIQGLVITGIKQDPKFFYRKQ